MVWLDFMAPHRHLVVDVTVTSARTNTNVPCTCARLPLLGSLALGAEHRKLDADIRTSALFGSSLALGAQHRKLDADIRTSALFGTPSV
jgi:hypothetical protein